MNSNIFGDEYQLLAIILSDLAALCFVLPLMFCKKGSVALQAENGFKHEALMASKLHIYFHVIIFFVFFFYILSVLLSVGFDFIKNIFNNEYLALYQPQRADYRIGGGLHSTFQNISIIYSIFLCVFVVYNWNKYSINYKIITFAVVILLGYCVYAKTFSKFYTLIPALSIIIAYQMSAFYRQHKKIPLFFGVLAGASAVIGIASLGFLRSRYTGASSIGVIVSQSFRQLSFAYDCPDNLTFILARCNSILVGDMNFLPLIHNFMSYIPRQIWPDKPLLFSNHLIMQQYLYERYTGLLGEMISPTFPGQLILSGGIFFMIFVSLLYGLFYKFIYEKAVYTISMPIKVLYIWSLLNINNIMRSGSSTLVSFGFFMLVIYICWWLLQIAVYFLECIKKPFQGHPLKRVKL